MTGQFVSAAAPGTRDLRFSAEEVTELAGITYRQLDHWIRNNHIQGDHLKDLGHGMPAASTCPTLLRSP
jgi:hypothetical protein